MRIYRLTKHNFVITEYIEMPKNCLLPSPSGIGQQEIIYRHPVEWLLYGTIHLSRQQFFTIYDPYPLPSAVFFTTIRRHIWPIFDPSPLKDADVLNGWSLCKCNKWRWVFMGVCSFQREGQNLHRLIFACTYHYGNVMYKAWISLQRSLYKRPVHLLLSRFYFNLS